MRSSRKQGDDKFSIDKPFNFESDATWRVFRIMSEFIDGFEFLAPLRKEVTFFGSARLPESSQWYQQARVLGSLLGKDGFTVITGGGPGIMEAANRGAHEVGAESIGLDIELPSAQRRNTYVKKGIGFHYFFTRKVMLSASAQAYIFFPGGFGTLDEFFEIATLLQTKKMEPISIVCVGNEFWRPLETWMRTILYENFKTISASDMDLFTIVDSAQAAFDIVKHTAERKYF